MQVRFQSTVLVALAILALAVLGTSVDWTRTFSAVVPETIDTNVQSTDATVDSMRDFEFCAECIENGLKRVRTNYNACAEAADQCQELQKQVLHSHSALILTLERAQRDAHDVTRPDQEVIDIQIDNHHQQLLEISNELAADMKQCVDDRTTCVPKKFEAKVQRALVDIQHLSEDAHSAKDHESLLEARAQRGWKSNSVLAEEEDMDGVLNDKCISSTTGL